MKKKKKNLSQVADLAGVSSATVSRLVNNTARVSPQVEKRIREAAKKLGVDLQRRSRSKLIAFLLSNRTLLHPFHSQVLVASDSYCSEHDYSLVFFPLHYAFDVSWNKLHLPRILQKKEVLDGCILAGVNAENLLGLLKHSGFPFAIFGDTVQGQWNSSLYDVVWIDDVSGAYDMTRYLSSLGHRHIWYLANIKMTWFERRHQGYCRAVEELGLERLVATLDSEDESEIGILGTKYILRSGKPVEAIFCGSDAIAHGVYAALRDAGLQVPGDVSVAGFNDTPEATMLHPQLTSVRVFPDHVGRLLAELVMNRIADPTLPAQKRTIPTQVIKRESCERPVGITAESLARGVSLHPQPNPE